VKELVRVLEAGGVVAIATESFFGLLADASSQRALDALFSLKPRDADKSVGLILPWPEAWPSLVVDIPPGAHALAAALWPGPLSIALPVAPGVDARLSPSGTIAVRDPGPCPARQLARAFGRPLAATSANQPGAPPAVRDAEVTAAFGEGIKDGRLVVVPGEAPGGPPSTLVVVEARAVRLLRPGAVPAPALADVLGPLGLHLDGMPAPR
jgi:L-threonylcarbamoyladenylate synthase